jgi:hypothetical protein
MTVMLLILVVGRKKKQSRAQIVSAQAQLSVQVHCSHHGESSPAFGKEDGGWPPIR